MSSAPGKERPAAVCAAWAALFVLLALAWQFLTVRCNYAGNWTALFCTGEKLASPPALDFERIYKFPDSYGYDGQLYHYIAHDPAFGHGFQTYIDAPRLRYRRILVPGLAYLFAAGQARYIDAAFIAVVLAFLFLGAYWSSRYFVLEGLHPAWGATFLAVPAALVSIDRLTVDVALAALTVGFALYLRAGPRWKLYLVLVLAPLVRETGLLLVAGHCLHQAWRREWKQAAVFASTMLPAAGWYLFVHRSAGGSPVHLLDLPLRGFLTRLLDPPGYPFGPALSWLATALDYLALAGMLLGIVLALTRTRPPDAVRITCALFGILGIVLEIRVWQDAYSFARVLSPLLILVALGGLRASPRWAVLPLAMIVPRVAVQFGRQALGIFQGLIF